jgi:hypothetical protein
MPTVATVRAIGQRSAMRRAVTAIVTVGGVLVLAALVQLRCAVARDEAAPVVAAPSPAHAPAASERAPVVAVAQPAPAPAPVAPLAPAPSRQAALVAPSLPSLAAAFGWPTEPPKPPIATKTEMREQEAAITPKLEACVAAARAGGYTASGTVLATYTLVPQTHAGPEAGARSEAKIESTGIDYDKTTIDNTPFLDCVRETASSMKFRYVPDTSGVYAMRKITFENGKLTEHSFVDFHYVQ